MPCNDEPCFETRGKVGNLANDVTILSIDRVTLSWNTNQPVAGTEQNIPPNRIDPSLKNAINSHLGQERGFIVKSPLCPEGCYCRIGIKTAPENSELVEETFEFGYVYVAIVRWMMSVTDGNNPHPDPETLADSITGRPGLDAETERPGTGVGGMPGMGLSIPIESLYLVKVKLKVKYEKFELHGECKPVKSFLEPDFGLKKSTK